VREGDRVVRERRQGDATLHDTTTSTPSSDVYSSPTPADGRPAAFTNGRRRRAGNSPKRYHVIPRQEATIGDKADSAADGPHVHQETRHVRQEVSDDPKEVVHDPEVVDHVPQEPRDSCRDNKTGDNTMKLLTWNVCRLLARGRELALVNILTSSATDIATITEFAIPEGSGEFSVAGYTTFSPTPSLHGGKKRVLILVKNDLAVRANVKVFTDIMDPAVQSVWLHFGHHRIGSATLGAFILGESIGNGVPC
jgi:hypothetical protein